MEIRIPSVYNERARTYVTFCTLILNRAYEVWIDSFQAECILYVFIENIYTKARDIKAKQNSCEYLYYICNWCVVLVAILHAILDTLLVQNLVKQSHSPSFLTIAKNSDFLVKDNRFSLGVCTFYHRYEGLLVKLTSFLWRSSFWLSTGLCTNS